MEKRFIELPSGEEVLKDITPQDQLVYLGIRSFMDKETLIAFPSVEAIANRIGASVPTVRKCIKHLVQNDYIKIEKIGNRHRYKFNELKQFEPFSYDFLNNKNLSFTNKAFLAAAQMYMYDKKSGIGKISYSKSELAEKINMSYPTLVRTTRELQNKNIIEIEKLKKLDSGTGCKRQEMQFNFNTYGQTIVSVLLNHEERIKNNFLFSEAVFETMSEDQKKQVLERYNEKVAQDNM